MKKLFDLKEKWYIATDHENAGKEKGYIDSIAEEAVSACVPSIIQEFFPGYHKTAFYWCRFTPELDLCDTERVMLNFGGVDYACEVWLNSEYLGFAESPETPFSFDATDAIRIGEENLLTVRVIPSSPEPIDGMALHYVPHRNKVERRRAGSNLNHSGIWYEVNLTAVPEVYITDKYYEGNIDTGEVKAKFFIKNLGKKKAEATLSVDIFDCTEKDRLATRATATVAAEVGSSEHEITLTIPSHKLWSTDEPNLYRMVARLESFSGTSYADARVGLREFKVEGGYFYLNRKRIFLKSSHSGNAFPIGQMLPKIPGQLRRDFIYAKAAGFNMLRAIAGQFRPEQIEIADEIGLLLYDECYASWCVGYSENAYYKNEEEFQKFVAEKGDKDVGTLAQMLERWDNSTDKMILRDRCSPSIVIWGLLNETRDNAVFRHAMDYLTHLRELDPSRLVILNSSRYDFDLRIASASSPYSYTWDVSFGNDGLDKNYQDDPMRYDVVGDNHKYTPVPMTAKDQAYYKNLGKNMTNAVFHSENGIGSLFNVIDEWRHFKQYGAHPDLEDCEWLEYQSRAFEKDFYEFGLDKLFAFPELLLRESQRCTAEDRARFFSIIRSNPRISGYSLTGLLDHGMCGEGLFSYFRKWKPNTFDAVADGWASLRFCLFATENSFTDEEITLEAHLANDGVLKSGTYHARFAIASDDVIYHRFDKEFELDENELAVPIFKESVKLSLPEGSYKFIAELDEGAPYAGSVEFFVTDRRSYEGASKEILIDSVSDGFAELVKKLALTRELSECNDTDKLLISGAKCKESLAKALDYAKKGGRVILLNTAAIITENDETKAMLADAVEGVCGQYNHEWLYHTEYVLADRGVFSHFGNDKIMRLARFGELFPKFSFNAKKNPDRAVCTGFLTGFYGVNDAYGVRHSLAGYKHGEGMIYLSGFKLEENLGHPNTVKILSGIINSL